MRCSAERPSARQGFRSGLSGSLAKVLLEHLLQTVGHLWSGGIPEQDRQSSASSDHGAAQPRQRSLMAHAPRSRSEEHTSELQSLMRISYAVFCLKKKNQHRRISHYTHIRQELK